MDIEQLKLIIDTLGKAGDGASSLVIWWLVLHYFTKLAGLAVFIFAVAYAVKTTTKIMAGARDWAAAGRRVARAWGGRASNEYLTSHDEEVIMEAIDAAQKKCPPQ